MAIISRPGTNSDRIKLAPTIEFRWFACIIYLRGRRLQNSYFNWKYLNREEAGVYSVCGMWPPGIDEDHAGRRYRDFIAELNSTTSGRHGTRTRWGDVDENLSMNHRRTQSHPSPSNTRLKQVPSSGGNGIFYANVIGVILLEAAIQMLLPRLFIYHTFL